jgi:GntR family negative regulator for fad regulon and positive regulator of fabA
MTQNEQQETAVNRAHRLLIERIITGIYPIGTDLPGERSLSKDLGVARNALREALQRLGQNGWLEISHGKATRVRDYLREGNLNILIDLLNIDHSRIRSFVPDLLQMWSLLAADYTSHAVRNEPNRLIERLELYASLADNAAASTQAMWQLHRALIDYCGNISYGLIFNSFARFYQRLALEYYQNPEKREQARNLWHELYTATQEKDHETAASIVSAYIRTDSDYWLNLPNIQTIQENPPPTEQED